MSNFTEAYANLGSLDRFGQLLVIRDHLRLYLEVMDIRFPVEPELADQWLRGWSLARSVNACRLLNVEEELESIAASVWPTGERQ